MHLPHDGSLRVKCVEITSTLPGRPTSIRSSDACFLFYRSKYVLLFLYRSNLTKHVTPSLLRHRAEDPP